ncbi:hypothetical protein COV13_01755 [Candidatus Woesearchaeota archaeon CG10_big_fil_rev_8_21_14_0_10_32_9]|nr:MAG: hypothetical protein COV13_01755 [Candidatus Woesearchaeota archaeon CG10_big_fil_rev_8_21_14_0_10_32_9]
MKLYKQTTDYTCASSSLLMIIHHFKPEFKLSRENEFKIWLETCNLPTRASSIYAMATFAKKQGLNMKLILEEKEYDYPDYRFKGYTKREIDDAKYLSKIHAREAEKNNIQIEERDITLEEIKDALKAGHILLLRVNAGIFRDAKSTSKYLVFYKMPSEHNFTILDPGKGILDVTEQMLEESLETLHTKKKRDHRVIIFE